MIAHKHIVRRQVIELTLQGNGNRPEIQRSIGELNRKRILPLLDKLFSEYGAYVKIDRLEIDLGIISSKDLETEVMQRLTVALRERLQNLFPPEDAVQHSGREMTTGVSPTAGAKIDAFGFFLQTGVFPYWFEMSPGFDADDFLAALLREDPIRLKETLQQLLPYAQVRRRMVHQFKSESLLMGVNLLFAPTPEIISLTKEVLDILHKQGARFHLLHVDEKKAWLACLNVTVHRQYTAQNILEYFLHWMEQLAGISNCTVGEIAHMFESVMPPVPRENTSLVSPGQGGILQALLETWKTMRKESREPGVYPAGLTRPSHSERKELQGQAIQQEEAGETPAAASQKTDLAVNDVHIAEAVVPNAGLVLLWPFFKNLFGALHLLEDKGFKDNYSQEKAIFLLNYLAGGGPGQVPEFNLVLNKLLCGFPLEVPLNHDVRISESEMQECDLLLETVVTHWKALKNTSIHGLRKTFIQRAGTLMIDDKEAFLTIQKETVDVLLSGIPWGYTMIKLPWTTKLIHVIW